MQSAADRTVSGCEPRTVSMVTKMAPRRRAATGGHKPAGPAHRPGSSREGSLGGPRWSLGSAPGAAPEAPPGASSADRRNARGLPRVFKREETQTH
eukprot:7680099-Pyramimonas_sp.AAC.1